MVVIRHHDRLSGCEYLLAVFIADFVDEGQAFVANAFAAHVDCHLLGELNRRQVGDVNISDDQVEVEEVLAIEQSQVHEVGNAGMLEEGQKARIIHMPLGIQIPVADVNRNRVVEWFHA